MLNNKGQSLVLFVVILPILLLILIFVMDIGKVILLKQELINISDLVLDYGLDKINNENLETELEELINLNKNDIDNIEVIKKNDKIYVNLNDKVEGNLSGIINLPVFKVKTSYVGYIEKNEKRIERMGD